MKENISKTTIVDLIFEKNTEVCANTINRIKQLLSDGFVLTDASYFSPAIRSTLKFTKIDDTI